MADFEDSKALIDMLTGGRGMPAVNDTQIGASRWYHDPRLSMIPQIQNIGELISGAPTTIKPSEGIEAVQGMADPIMHIAGMLAPILKAYIGREAAQGGIPSMGQLTSQRGSTGVPGDEDTLAALKRMFMQRGGVESGQGKAIPVSEGRLSGDFPTKVRQALNGPIHNADSRSLDSFMLEGNWKNYAESEFANRPMDIGAVNNMIKNSKESKVPWLPVNSANEALEQNLITPVSGKTGEYALTEDGKVFTYIANHRNFIVPKE